MRSNADDLSPEGAEPRVTVAPSHAPVQEEEEEEDKKSVDLGIHFYQRLWDQCHSQ